MTSPTQWPCVWVNSGSWWWTGRPGVLQSTGSQRVGHNWATELNWTECLPHRPHPPIKIICKVLTPSGTVFGDEALRVDLHDGIGVMNVTGRETRTPFLSCEDTGNSHLQARKGALSNKPGLGLPSSKTTRKNCLLFKLLSPRSVTTGPTKTIIYNISVCMLSCFSHVRLSANLWTVAHQAPLSMRFSRWEYWSELPFPSPGDLPDPGIEPMSPGAPTLQVGSLPLSHQGSQWYI